MWRNVNWNSPPTTVRVMQCRDALRLQLKVARPWNVYAGQYIYIWIPGVSFWSIFQTHPFMVTWWDLDLNGNGSTIYVLVKRKSGFTNKLHRHVGASNIKAWVDGPYGTSIQASRYGNILMFASGIGIATQVPFIKEILRDYKNYIACTKSILLVWLLEEEGEIPFLWHSDIGWRVIGDQEWVQDWMDELLADDEGSYVCQNTLSLIKCADNFKKRFWRFDYTYSAISRISSDPMATRKYMESMDASENFMESHN